MREQRLVKENGDIKKDLNTLHDKYNQLLEIHYDTIEIATTLGEHISSEKDTVSGTAYYQCLTLVDQLLEKSGVIID